MISGIILSAGKGSRLNNNVAKGNTILIDRPLIMYVYEAIKDLVDSLLCVVGYKKEEIKEILKDNVSYAYQEKLDGTAGAVKACLNQVPMDGYSLITMCDLPLITSNDYSMLIKNMGTNKDIYALGFRSEKENSYGRIIDNRVYEASEGKRSDKYFAGVMLVKNSFLHKHINEIDNDNKNSEYYITKLFDYTDDSEFIMIEEENAVGINTKKDLNYACEYLFDKKKKELIENGVIVLGESFISYFVNISSGTIIYPGTIILGDSIIGKNNEIGPNSFIKDSIIKDGNTIISSYIMNSSVGSNNQIGPFSHLRSGVVVEDSSRIGNFVEMKNTMFGANSKASHLGYLGDSIVGKNVNFGCGAITVNYDGKKKHQTIIGENAFIGSNSNLVAPVNIASNSMIACGSTIVSDVFEGEMGIARAYQINKKLKKNKLLD